MKSFTCKKPFWVNFRKYLLQYPPQLNCRNKERPGCKIGGNNFLSSNKIRIGRGPRCYNVSDFLQRFPILNLKSRIDARKRG